MSRIIWCAPDGSWGECDSNDMLIIDESCLTDDDRDMIMGGNLSETETRVYLTALCSLPWTWPGVAVLSNEEREVVRDALAEAANVWRADFEREWQMAKRAAEDGKSRMVRRKHATNAKEFRHWSDVATRLFSKFHADAVRGEEA